jgi:hypothetical protein
MKLPFAKARTYISEKVKTNYQAASQTAYKKAGVDLGESAYYAAIPIIATIAGKVIVVNVRHSTDKYTSLINKPPEILSPAGIIKYGFDDPVGNFILGAGLTASLLYGFIKSRATRIAKKQHVEVMTAIKSLDEKISKTITQDEEISSVIAKIDELKGTKEALEELKRTQEAFTDILSEDIGIMKEYLPKPRKRKSEQKASQQPPSQESQQQIPPQ